MNKNLRVAFNFNAILMEGLHWDESKNLLWGVDIHGKLLWSWNLRDFLPTMWEFDQKISWIIPIKNSENLLLGLQNGIGISNRYKPNVYNILINLFTHDNSMRLNDAKADVNGNIWTGSLNNDDENKEDGKLYKFSYSGILSELDFNYKVTNGPAINPKNNVFFHNDSGKKVIYSLKFNSNNSNISSKKKWKVFDEKSGYPDGMCFDSDGNLWVAHWGGNKVSCLSPNGELLKSFDMPAKNVTNVCFAGKNLERLFVSTAKDKVLENKKIKHDLNGALFEIISPGACGLKTFSANEKFSHLIN
mgnify:CR=1 FL=1|tara:strand:+ start:655 stop:1563 length:909 start_codon:yes stop_codon:yes gene_type:complete